MATAERLGRWGFNTIGDVIRLESILDAQARSGRVSWAGRFRLVE